MTPNQVTRSSHRRSHRRSGGPADIGLLWARVHGPAAPACPVPGACGREGGKGRAHPLTEILYGKTDLPESMEKLFGGTPEIKGFYCQGGLDYEHMGAVDRAMMAALRAAEPAKEDDPLIAAHIHLFSLLKRGRPAVQGFAQPLGVAL